MKMIVIMTWLCLTDWTIIEANQAFSLISIMHSLRTRVMKYLAGIKKVVVLHHVVNLIEQRMHNTLHSTEDTKPHQYHPLSQRVWAITSAVYPVKSALQQKAMISSSNHPSIDQQLPLLRKIVSMKSSASENSRGHSSETGLLYLLERFCLLWINGFFWRVWN